MVKISYILNVSVQLAVTGCCFSWVMHCRDNIVSSVFLQIRFVSIGRKTSRKTQWPVFVEFSIGCDTEIII
jgi:hypothetical protein